MTRITRRMVAGALLLAAGGCAPVMFAGGQGVALGITRGGSPSLGLASCSLAGTASYAGLSTNAAVQVSGYRQRIATIQSKLMLGARSIGASREGWKRVASGGC